MSHEITSNRRHIVLGILAHVDAGKTTLSESLLYLSGAIRRQGRVDHGDAYLDTDSMERQRGITIFSKQAQLSLPDFGGLDITLLDTPGHADFSPEMERTLSVLDYAVLVISAPDGVTGQVRTLWRLLAHYHIPVFLFVNKMDQPGMEPDPVLKELSGSLDTACIPLPDTDPEHFDAETAEALAVCDDRLLEQYLELGQVPSTSEIAALIAARKLFPVYFGSALKNTGVDTLLRGLSRYTAEPALSGTFSAKVFKISRDAAGTRLAWMRVLSGTLYAKMEVTVSGTQRSQDAPSGLDASTPPTLKVDQLRQYSGDSFSVPREAPAGQIVCATGLDTVSAGQILRNGAKTGQPGNSPEAGAAARRPGSSPEVDVAARRSDSLPKVSETAAMLSESLQRRSVSEQLILPVFRSAILLTDDTDPVTALHNLKLLQEEEPMLGVEYDPRTKQISAEIMGEVETEIIRNLCEKRFGMSISFGPPSVVYRETIAAPVEGVGHYEPLRHYAEVHLLLEPAERGSGITFDTNLSTDALPLNWQRLVLSSLMSVHFRGVLTGSEITDLHITLIGGRASEKHTEGGDFRQASIRALRQGLMSAESILLEPWYRFEAEIPQDAIGRLMSDIQRMDGRLDPVGGDGVRAQVTGFVPAAETGDYAAEVRAYTHGTGQISFSLSGYEPCRNSGDVILKAAYDPASDLEQPADSVFCSHGAGVTIPWNEVRRYMHVDTGWHPDTQQTSGGSLQIDSRQENGQQAFSSQWRRSQTAEKKSWLQQQRDIHAGEEELRRIFEQTYKGSSWSTPLHDPANDFPDDSAGLWSRDGSLERSAGLPAGSGKDSPDGPDRQRPSQRRGTDSGHAGSGSSAREDYLLVDGYNIIFNWPELRELAAVNLDSAAGRLTEILSDFQGTQSGRLIIVFDAYKVHGGKRHIIHQGTVDIIYTKEAETADSYIMELTHTLAKKGNVTVATGDGIVQMIIFSAGARRMSAGELKDRVNEAKKKIRDRYHI
ncbi:MAG: translation factor GTPase family protein [Porcincola intestinalis]|uniref:translation factor GTPase family protein n=1 Tax=Porcincola intestinalis TaxID=2606632 RepID=UPI0029DA3645|nr:translation factor GTPase family protein [Porcincola intestinalis]MCI6237779.1 NYN domain-containing protein [Lachnospiraceae bacterium]MDY5331751.1 translation factor GTPase family protein [Porcincola intestinalis]